ncbi:MAG: hypothetical protein JOZ69_06805, partial [Myxococcales bacterium]|nr:hypothetical protein [Myxococcales bacterium]
DFGIATILGGPTERLAFGTPRYMAPEILEGEAASPQADIYSTALVLYQMLAGRFPWDVDVRSASAMAEAHLKLPPARLSRYVPRLPPAVDDCLLSALAKDPSARPASAYEFAARLCLLQFVSDAPARGAVDLDTTAPTLATLAEAVTEGFELDPNDTVRGMQAPAVEGPPPEVASDPSFGRVDTGREAPWFDVQDGAPSAAALRPRTEPSTTPTQTPRAQRRPEHDTLPISSPSRSAGEGPPAQPRAVSASEPPASAVVLEAHAVVTPMTASVSSRGRRRGREAWAAAAVAAALVLPMAGGGVAFFAHKPTAAAPPLARPVPVEEVLTAGGASREARSEPAAGRVGVPAGGPSSLVAAQEPSRAVASIRKVPPPILKPAARAPSASPPLSSSPRPAPPPPMFEW